MAPTEPNPPYRGRLAPSPTGHLHLGHARTFWTAQQRAQARGGALILRNEDLDTARCQPAFATAMLEDLRWFGFAWQEGPDCGGPFGPYVQSERRALYLGAIRRLFEAGAIYPCACSRQDVLRALRAPHQGEDEPLYPGTCRPTNTVGRTEEAEGKTEEGEQDTESRRPTPTGACPPFGERSGRGEPRTNWRFRVPDGEAVSFVDGHQGPQAFVAGRDFGDFVVWRHDGIPAYQLAVVVDDAAMRITEVVRGADLLKSAARQTLLYRALGWEPPAFYHCPLMTDEAGQRLAKRHEALSLRQLRAQGRQPEELRAGWR
jgi:glutamyl/glutaminyl-tRNA synthetase